MFIGVGLKLKDKRVDKMLLVKNIISTDIFYSPISTWILLLLLILTSGWWLLYIFASTKYGLLLIPYFVISYLLNGYKSNSFALCNDNLIVINPNIPFRQITVINNSDIQLVTIDKTTRKWTKIFLDFGENYLLIQTKDNTYKFNCAGLDLDAYDENWTEKTIDDLRHKLKEKGIKTLFNLDN